MSTIEVLITVPFGDQFVEQLQAVDPRLRVRQAPAELRRWLRDSDHTATVTDETERQVVEFLEPAEVVVGWARLTDAARARATHLRWIQAVSAGVDRLDPADYQQVIITNASGVAAAAMAEYVIGVMLLFAKGFPHLLRLQRTRTWDRAFQAQEICGKTCGIVGMGAIGGETARRARAMGMRVLATRRSTTPRDTDEFADELLSPDDLPYLLEESDYVVVAAPLTPETRGMLGAAELARMKPTAVLINVGRGQLLDQQALIEALRGRRLAGAGLDVFEQEPLPADSPLWELENVVVTPHVSGGTERYAERAAEIVGDNLRRYLAGEPLRNIVDLGRGY